MFPHLLSGVVYAAAALCSPLSLPRNAPVCRRTSGRSSMRMPPFFVQTACVMALSVAAEAAYASKIYTCEVGGVTVYTSRPSGGCHSADLPVIGKYSSAPYNQPEAAVYSTQPQPEPARRKTTSAKSGGKANTAKAVPVAPVRAAPAMAAPAPKAPANNSRRSILETELANERKALGDAQKALAQARTAKGGSVNQEQINQLQGSVFDRQQNIQALQRELGRM